MREGRMIGVVRMVGMGGEVMKFEMRGGVFKTSNFEPMSKKNHTE